MRVDKNSSADTAAMLSVEGVFSSRTARDHMPKIAVLFDAENIDPRHAPSIIKAAGQFGTPAIIRAYAGGEMLQGKSWRLDAYAAAGATSIMVPIVKTGKSSCDIAIAVDAVEIAITRKADIVCIASSDADFAPVARKLKEIGTPVIGVGSTAGSVMWRGSCTHFIPIDRCEARFFKTTDDVVQMITDNFGGSEVPLTIVGIALRKIDPTFTPKAYGEKTLAKLLRRDNRICVRNRDGVVYLDVPSSHQPIAD